jgi:hypothetical protein
MTTKKTSRQFIVTLNLPKPDSHYSASPWRSSARVHRP